MHFPVSPHKNIRFSISLFSCIRSFFPSRKIMYTYRRENLTCKDVDELRMYDRQHRNRKIQLSFSRGNINPSYRWHCYNSTMYYIVNWEILFTNLALLGLSRMAILLRKLSVFKDRRICKNSCPVAKRFQKNYTSSNISHISPFSNSSVCVIHRIFFCLSLTFSLHDGVDSQFYLRQKLERISNWTIFPFPIELIIIIH